uniref:OsmC family protein n=1 Tax=Alistipes sp. TaxID=1872444 RepID=UPI004055C7A2
MQYQVTILREAFGRFLLKDHDTLDELNPKELFLYAAILCSAYTIDSILKKKRLDVEELEISIVGELSTDELQAESIYNSFMVHYNVRTRSAEEQAAVAQAIRLSHEKYCGLMQMLRKVAPLSHEIAIYS